MKLLTILLGGMSLLCNFAQAVPAAEALGLINDPLSGVLGHPSLLPPPGNSKESSPNPIASIYPTTPTGTLNGTLAIVPIPYQLAREIIPAKYRILNGAYESLLPNFPASKYPLVVRILVDHDIRLGELTGLVPDFQTVHFVFPFVDLLNDGYSNFAYEKFVLVTYNNQIAITGISSYGEIPVLARFSPQDEAYAFSPRGRNVEPGSYFTAAFTPPTDAKASFTSKFSPLSHGGPWPFDFYKNVTNQPVFGNGLACHKQITLYNSTISQGANAPIGIRGEIVVSASYLTQDCVFKGVYGYKVDAAFIDYSYQECETLKGYTGP